MPREHEDSFQGFIGAKFPQKNASKRHNMQAYPQKGRLLPYYDRIIIPQNRPPVKQNIPSKMPSKATKTAKIHHSVKRKLQKIYKFIYSQIIHYRWFF